MIKIMVGVRGMTYFTGRRMGPNIFDASFGSAAAGRFACSDASRALVTGGSTRVVESRKRLLSASNWPTSASSCLSRSSHSSIGASACPLVLYESFRRCCKNCGSLTDIYGRQVDPPHHHMGAHACVARPLCRGRQRPTTGSILPCRRPSTLVLPHMSPP